MDTLHRILWVGKPLWTVLAVGAALSAWLWFVWHDDLHAIEATLALIIVLVLVLVIRHLNKVLRERWHESENYDWRRRPDRGL